MRCPHCQAANPDTATFCGQCYERFPLPQAPSPAPGAAGPRGTAPDAVGPGAPAAGAAGPAWPGASAPASVHPETAEPGTAHDGTTGPGTPPPGAGDGSPGDGSGDRGEPVAVGRFVAGEGGLTWRCAICETTHEVGVFVCTVCGAKMDAESTAGAGPPVDLDQAKRLEAIVPGLGHLRTGHSGLGAARIGIVAVWLLGSLALATGGPSGLLTALPMVIGMVLVWATGPGDLSAAVGGRPPRLDARRFMYLVIGVTTGVIIAGGLVVIL